MQSERSRKLVSLVAGSSKAREKWGGGAAGSNTHNAVFRFYFSNSLLPV